MKKLLGLVILLAVFLAGCVIYVPQGDNSAPPPDRNDNPWNYDDQGYSDFYDYLSPYGLWVSYAPYGYVWIPRDVGYHWRPYYLGRWVWTDYGWTWVAQERWGWLPFHYGRWGWDHRMGWFWVPGTVWGPAWVGWRWGGPYIGWAALPPGDDFMPGRGFGRRKFDIPGHYWNFVRGQEFMDPRLDRWIVPPERNVTIINYTQIDVNIHVRNDRVINDGPGADHVGRVTNQTIQRHQLKDAGKPGEDRVEASDVVLFRPALKQSEKAKPKQVLDQDQAARKLEAEPVPAGQTVSQTTRDAEAAIRQKQDDERRRLENDQKAEVKEIRRRADSQKAAVTKPADKEKIDATAKARLAEAEKRQAAEKAEMEKRHKAEGERVKKVPPDKKDPEKY
jgi:hypothetical protein